MRKKNLIFNLFSIFQGIISEFLGEESTSVSKINFAYPEQLQQKSGRTGKALYVSSGTIGGKSFGTNQNFLTFRQWVRKYPRNVFSRCGRNALNLRIQINTLKKMKFSIQKSNAEYIILFERKHSGLVAQSFIRILRTGIHVSWRPFWKKFFLRKMMYF